MFTPANHVKCKAGDAWIDKRPYRRERFLLAQNGREKKRKEKKKGREGKIPPPLIEEKN